MTRDYTPIERDAAEVPTAGEATTGRNNNRKRRESKALRDLLLMLKTCRPAETAHTRRFGETWLKPLGAKIDTAGNWLLRIPKADGTRSRAMWSSHIDTVHHIGGVQMTSLNQTTGIVQLHSKESSNCLGADCTTGVWLMREMALAGVPGFYVWHEAEECGGLGSRYLSMKASLFKDIDFAVAFDRAGKTDVITYQSCGRCCSDDFARSLALQLPGSYKPCEHGVFTDTANYTSVIGECSNISVGYTSQHFMTETQDVVFAMELRAALLRIDETKLVLKRKPGEYESRYARYGRYSPSGSDFLGDTYPDWGYTGGAYYDRYDGLGKPYYRRSPTYTKPAETRQAVSPMADTAVVAPTVVVTRTPDFLTETECGGFCGGKCVGFCRPEHDEQRKKFLERAEGSTGEHDTFSKVLTGNGETSYVYSRAKDPRADTGASKALTVVSNSNNRSKQIAQHKNQLGLEDLVTRYPQVVAEYLEQGGVEVEDMLRDMELAAVVDYLERSGVDADEITGTYPELWG